MFDSLRSTYRPCSSEKQAGEEPDNAASVKPKEMIAVTAELLSAYSKAVATDGTTAVAITCRPDIAMLLNVQDVLVGHMPTQTTR